VANALEAVINEDAALAKKVIDADARTNMLELEIDNAVVDVLALKQPVASDLRLILAVQKINNDLERIGDHAVNIAESALGLKDTINEGPLLEIPKMAVVTRELLHEALDSFILLDPELAQSVLKKDDVIDDLNRDMNQEAIELIKKDKEAVDGAMQLIRISRNLERTADLATNIAEEVIFLTQARFVKHHSDERIH
jgi:phosphate transport system protein